MKVEARGLYHFRHPQFFQLTVAPAVVLTWRIFVGLLLGVGVELAGLRVAVHGLADDGEPLAPALQGVAQGPVRVGGVGSAGPFVRLWRRGRRAAAGQRALLLGALDG